MTDQERRNAAAEYVTMLIGRHDNDARGIGDRITFKHDGHAVTLVVATATEIAMVMPGVCPFCGSTKLHSKPETETFRERRGCLDCDNWLDPVRVKR